MPAAFPAEIFPHVPFRLRAEERMLHFRTPARTSRGALGTRRIFYVHAESEAGCSTGECSPMPALSPDAGADFPQRLQAACEATEKQQGLRASDFRESPAIRFGLETALFGLRHPRQPLWDTPFSRGESGIRIHHLIWMNSAEQMLQQMQAGIDRGFDCLKLKIGALPFEDGLAMLAEARRRFPNAEIRVDANGAFGSDTARAARSMEQLAAVGVSLIEQPLRAGQAALTAELARAGILPLALDEELIGCTDRAAREQLLDLIAPQGLVIKPTLHGGLSGAEEWAAAAEARGIAWWVNSALESHVGLSHLAQWCGKRAPQQLHGLGTGALYTDDDFLPNLHLKNCLLHYL